MSRVPCWNPRIPFLSVVVSAAVAAAACADRSAPLLAPRPPHAFGTIYQDPPPPQCNDSTGRCDCTSNGGDSSCGPLPPSVPPPDSTKSSRLRILAAGGSNPERSFTTQAGERTLTLSADVAPAALAGVVTWAVVDEPTDRVQSVAPLTRPPNGSSSNVDLPSQTTARWERPHGTAWTDKALAFKVMAEAPNLSGGPPLRDSAVVRQRELDVLRQEYVDFKIPVPAAADVRTAADVAGATRFSWAELNQGDYRLAVLTPRLLQKLPELQAMTSYALRLNSVFRNPAHQRFHIKGGTATLSPHQYGTAVDLATYNDRTRWDALKDVSKRAGACVEPLKMSKLHHVHADWRPSAPVCPEGW